MDELGYQIKRILDEEDLTELKERISKQIIDVACKYSESLNKRNRSIDPMADYKSIEKLIDHNKVWTKNNRLLSKEDANWFENCNSIIRLSEELESQGITDEEQIGRSNIYAIDQTKLRVGCGTAS